MFETITVAEFREIYFSLWVGAVLAVLVGLFIYGFLSVLFERLTRPLHSWLSRRIALR